jgi:hypothetical protein
VLPQNGLYSHISGERDTKQIEATTTDPKTKQQGLNNEVGRIDRMTMMVPLMFIQK